MGKIRFNFDDKGLSISDCDAINTNPKECETCEHRFQCFTERRKAGKTVLSSQVFPNLNDMMKQIALEFDEPKDR